MNDREIAALILGEAPAIRELRSMIVRVAPTILPVLIQGPTGSGKELVARALHVTSGRRGALVAFNVCAIADSMFEDALFGHVRGAFTGAVSDTRGYVGEADSGTLFLDEVGSLGGAMQTKLLRTLDSGYYRPVGAAKDRHSDFRLVSATNDDLVSLVERGSFRADLRQRLAGAVLHVPPLTARREDMKLLVEHFLRDGSHEAPTHTISSAALRLLEEHDWPGNVRELRHVIGCARALAVTRQIGRDDVADVLALGRSRTQDGSESNAERAQLIDALASADWQPDRAALILGVHRVTIYRRMKRLNVHVPSRRHSIFTREVGGGHS